MCFVWSSLKHNFVMFACRRVVSTSRCLLPILRINVFSVFIVWMWMNSEVKYRYLEPVYSFIIGTVETIGESSVSTTTYKSTQVVMYLPSIQILRSFLGPLQFLEICVIYLYKVSINGTEYRKRWLPFILLV